MPTAAPPDRGGYRPEQQAIASRVFTTAGWLSGDVRAPKRHVWLDHLNTCGAWIKMTDVTLPTGGGQVSFFALARSSAVLVEPTSVDPALATQTILGNKAVHDVDCLLDVGVVRGRLELPPNIRVSDHLAQHSEFMALHDCRLQLFGRYGEATLEMQLALAFINCSRIVGVSEMDLG